MKKGEKLRKREKKKSRKINFQQEKFNKPNGFKNERT